MPLSFRSRRLVALLACWALLWAAFLPALVGASSPAGSVGIEAVLHASLCSAHAPVVAAGDDTPAPSGQDAPVAAAHCPLCSSAGEHAAPLAARPPAVPAASAEAASPAPLARALPPDRRWPGVSPRGPPASC